LHHDRVQSGTQSEQVFTSEQREPTSLQYLLYLPEEYDVDERDWPLVLFLHGAGQRSDCLQDIAKHGPPQLLNSGKHLPAIVVSPQCRADESWEPAQLFALLDEITAKHRVNRARVAVTGLSMGGYATWDLIVRQPTRFAAAAPICGGGHLIKYLLAPEAIQNELRKLPVWAFHGARDPLVPIEQTRIMVEELRRIGGNVQFTVYPEAEHDSWTETYENPEFFDWLLSQSR
jgi:predicted peptidase